jgi:hypothetical protein
MMNGDAHEGVSLPRSKAPRRVALCLLIPVLAGLTATAGQTERKGSSGAAEIILKKHQQEMLDGYVELLRSYPGFDSTDGVAHLRPWTYATPSDQNLARVSEHYKFDEIAGQGSEVGRFLRLMEWAHRITQGRGDLCDPDALNTPAILEFVRSTGRPVNCRMKAIVLNEALLALGCRSRRISFQPAKHDGDSHSIVTVFSRELGRWICLDPTFNTYFHDDNGVPLGYLEVRDAYRRGRVPGFRSITIPVEGELMLAGQAFDRYDPWYAVYMAKNCFKVSCPQRSDFGYESSDSPAWIALHPVGYQPDTVGRVNTTYTTDARSFFLAP